MEERPSIFESNASTSAFSSPASCYAIYVPITRSIIDVKKGIITLTDAISTDWRIGSKRMNKLNAANVAVGVVGGRIEGVFVLNGYHKNPNGNGRIVLDLGAPVFPAAIGHKTTFRFNSQNVHFDSLNWLP